MRRRLPAQEKPGQLLDPSAPVRKLMMDAGLWISRALRSPKIYQPRNRRQCVGELIQIDGSDHAWLGGADHTQF